MLVSRRLRESLHYSVSHKTTLERLVRILNFKHEICPLSTSLWKTNLGKVTASKFDICISRGHNDIYIAALVLS